MKEKLIQEKLRTTVRNEDVAVSERFAKADTAFIKPAELPAASTSGKSLVIRDTFSLPPNDHALIEVLRSRAAKTGSIFNRSEVVRAGLHALMLMDDKELVAVLTRLDELKPGRKS